MTTGAQQSFQFCLYFSGDFACNSLGILFQKQSSKYFSCFFPLVKFNFGWALLKVLTEDKNAYLLWMQPVTNPLTIRTVSSLSSYISTWLLTAPLDVNGSTTFTGTLFLLFKKKRLPTKMPKKNSYFQEIG